MNRLLIFKGVLSGCIDRCHQTDGVEITNALVFLLDQAPDVESKRVGRKVDTLLVRFLPHLTSFFMRMR